MPSSRGSSPPRDQTQVFVLRVDSLPSEPPRKPIIRVYAAHSVKVGWSDLGWTQLGDSADLMGRVGGSG